MTACDLVNSEIRGMLSSISSNLEANSKHVMATASKECSLNKVNLMVLSVTSG